MPTNEPTTLGAGLIRLCWMIIGPMVLVLLAFSLTNNNRGWGGLNSIAFLVILVGVIIARRADPNTADGVPSTQAQLRKYSIGALAIGIATWLIANIVGNHWIDQ